MAQFIPALQKVLTHEGGYGNDPNDSGGETYKGIARKMQGDWSGWTVIDQCKKQSGFPSNLENEANLQLQVNNFYKQNFWDTINADKITNQAMAESIFDFGVNVGVKKSAMLAQKVVGAAVDGIIGIHALEQINSYEPAHFLAAFAVEKIAYYIQVVKNTPKNKMYFYGWVCRAMENYL